jgi:hypothetical protein
MSEPRVVRVGKALLDFHSWLTENWLRRNVDLLGQVESPAWFRSVGYPGSALFCRLHTVNPPACHLFLRFLMRLIGNPSCMLEGWSMKGVLTWLSAMATPLGSKAELKMVRFRSCA